MRLILATLATVGLLAISLAIAIAAGALRLPPLDAFPTARPTTLPADTRPAADATAPADSEDSSDPLLPDPSKLDRAIVLTADRARLTGPRVRLHTVEAGEPEAVPDHERGMGRQRGRMRRMEGRPEEGPPPPVIQKWSTPQDQAEWTFTVPQGGTYAVTFVYTTRGSPVRFELEAGGEKIVVSVEPTGRGYQMVEVGKLELPAGETTLRLRPAEKLDDPLLMLRSVTLYPLP